MLKISFNNYGNIIIICPYPPQAKADGALNDIVTPGAKSGQASVLK